MKNAFLIALAAVFALGLLCPSGQAEGTAPASDDLVGKARSFLERLDKGDFAGAAADFDETMMKVSGPDKLAAFWKEVPARMGAFRRQTDARREKLDPYDIVLVTCEFANVTLDARVVFDKAGRIAGFQFVPSLPPAEYRPPAYADPARFEEIEVTVGSPGWPLPAILTLPKGGGPFPALVLVHGSGPNDKDETIGPNKPFKDIAWGLAAKGVAVLRYEKRTRVFGPKLVMDRELASSFTVKEETIDDALAAVSFLKKADRVDPERIFVLGHSLGGMLIPRIAAAGKGLGIAGYVVMAGLTRPLEDTIVRQMTYLYGLDGGLSADDRSKLDELKAQVARVKAFTDKDAASGESVLNAPVSYWLDMRGYDPPALAATLDARMLVLQGARDYQVTTDDFENWKKALIALPRVSFKLYPKLNHLFFEGQGLPTPDEYTRTHGSVAPYVIDDIAAFIGSAGSGAGR
jgi:dienelactone hydrolase